MLWEETESTARGCSYIVGGVLALLGIGCVTAALLASDWTFLTGYLIALGVFMVIVLLWVVVAGGVMGALLGLSKSIAWVLAVIRRRHGVRY